MIEEGTNHILKGITDLITKSNDAMNKQVRFSAGGNYVYGSWENLALSFSL